MESAGGEAMKILYIAPYKDGTGWAEAATRTMLALDKTGVEVVPRQFSYNGRNEYLHPRIKELESHTVDGCDAVIQNVLPHNMEYVPELFNFGMYMSETPSTLKADWNRKLTCMDAILCPNPFSISAARKGCNIDRLPFCIPAQEEEAYQKKYPSILKLKDKFVFYFIGELSVRKNLLGLLIAFHTEFHPQENVELVIKTTVPNKSGQEAQNVVAGICDDVKTKLKLYGNNKYYKKEIIITDRISHDSLMGLHQDADCFCMLSHGEALCLPALDAICFDNYTIVSDIDGLKEIGELKNTQWVGGKMSPCFGALDTFDYLYTGHDEWFVPDLKDAKRAMRYCFSRGKRKKVPAVTYNRKQEYCGKELRGILESCLSYCSQ